MRGIKSNMRKLTAIVSLLLIMALAMPAYAAINIKGKVATRTALAENAKGEFQFQGQGEVDLNIAGNVSSGPVRADINYELRTGGWGAQFGASGGSGFSGTDGDPNLLEAYLTFTGPFLPGGKNLTTKIGRFQNNVTANGMGLVGYFDRKDWVQISGIGVGPATLALHYGHQSTTKTIAAISGTANVDVLTISGIVVKTDENVDVTKNENIDYAVRVAAKPTSDLSLQLDYASDGKTEASGEDPATAWIVSGTLSSIQNLKLTAKAWTTDNKFEPEYSQNNGSHETLLRDRRTPDRQANIGDPYIAKGFSVGIETQQAGLPIKASVKTGTIFDEVGSGEMGLPSAQSAFLGKRMTVVDASTTIADFGVALAYTTIEDFKPVTDITVTRTFKGLIVGDVNTRAAVRLRNGAKTEYSADATWKAPNGLNLGVHYANYDRLVDESGTTGWSGPNVGKAGEADGFAISAGYTYSW